MGVGGGGSFQRKLSTAGIEFRGSALYIHPVGVGGWVVVVGGALVMLRFLLFASALGLIRKLRLPRDLFAAHVHLVWDSVRL